MMSPQDSSSMYRYRLFKCALSMTSELMAACFFPMPSCSCTTSVFARHVFSTKACSLTLCAILSLTSPLTYTFSFPPVGYRVQEEMGFSGYQAWSGGQRYQYRLWSCALGYTFSCEFLLFPVCMYDKTMIDLCLSVSQVELLFRLLYVHQTVIYFNI